MIECNKNENGHFRGLHVVIIDPKTGELKLAEVFDTYKSSERLDRFINHGIPKELIIICACKDDISKNLSTTAKIWLEQMGAKHIYDVEYRQAYAFVGLSGKPKFTSDERGENFTT